MPRIFDFGGRDVTRTVTVASLRALRHGGGRVTQVTVETAEEAAAAEAAGIEMAVCRAASVARVREGSRALFLTAALGFAEAVTDEEVLRSAFAAVTAGADAVITGRSARVVRLLSDEQIPVMGHLGFVPRKSTWTGSVRAVGKTEEEALELWDRFRLLEDAGAFAVECELIAAPLMAEIRKRSGLVTVSLGSGSDADVIFLFTSDICGESARLPRHARVWGDLRTLNEAIRAERLRALSGFRSAVRDGSYPAAGEMSPMAPGELENFNRTLEG